MKDFCKVCKLSPICLPIGPRGMAGKVGIQLGGHAVIYKGKAVECCGEVALLASQWSTKKIAEAVWHEKAAREKAEEQARMDMRMHQYQQMMAAPSLGSAAGSMLGGLAGYAPKEPEEKKEKKKGLFGWRKKRDKE